MLLKAHVVESSCVESLYVESLYVEKYGSVKNPHGCGFIWINYDAVGIIFYPESGAYLVRLAL
ncbi:hypothetical protein VSP9026_00062 [Vibrio spartinae]|uniref:Uncharacterized protein n=1 Tax=Vibrio spartinae TaxID=1918945 RepID=A0A1N6LZ47_9VIBR|nr:hypothetical protein VSP9026_00062 [Vibrio spartinae]